MERTERLSLAVTEHDFEHAVLESKVPVLVDFSAIWCGPCKAIEPTIESLAAAYGDRLKVATVDVDESPTLAEQYQVRSVPTVMLLADGEIKRVFVGARPESEYRAGIEAFLH
jgi:thioredoxin 1